MLETWRTSDHLRGSPDQKDLDQLTTLSVNVPYKSDPLYLRDYTLSYRGDHGKWTHSREDTHHMSYGRYTYSYSCETDGRGRPKPGFASSNAMDSDCYLIIEERAQLATGEEAGLRALAS